MEKNFDCDYKYGEFMDLYDENKKLTGEKKFREKGEKLNVQMEDIR